MENLRRRAESDAKSSGCYLNPDAQFLKDLLEGLKQNAERYGYSSCPCRLASGKIGFDRDILCPCDYRDIDVQEFGACYCGLYFRKDVFEGKTPLQPVPERRPMKKFVRAYGEAEINQPEHKVDTNATVTNESVEIKLKLWYCKQCGYVCFLEEPPYICPICKAKRELFATLNIKENYQAE